MIEYSVAPFTLSLSTISWGAEKTCVSRADDFIRSYALSRDAKDNFFESSTFILKSILDERIAASEYTVKPTVKGPASEPLPASSIPAMSLCPCDSNSRSI